MASDAYYRFRVPLFQKFQRIFYRLRHHVYGVTSEFSSKICGIFGEISVQKIIEFCWVEISRKFPRKFTENTQYSLVYFGSFVIIISNLDVRVVTILPFQYFPLFLGKFSRFFTFTLNMVNKLKGKNRRNLAKISWKIVKILWKLWKNWLKRWFGEWLRYSRSIYMDWINVCPAQTNHFYTRCGDLQRCR